jgi:hypothetical protein
LYRLDYLGRLNGLPDSNAIPHLSIEMLKPQPRGEEKSRDEVLKRELRDAFFCPRLQR